MLLRFDNACQRLCSQRDAFHFTLQKFIVSKSYCKKRTAMQYNAYWWVKKTETMNTTGVWAGVILKGFQDQIVLWVIVDMSDWSRWCGCMWVYVQNVFQGIPSDFTEMRNFGLRGTFFALYTWKQDWNAASSYCRLRHKDAHLVMITSDKKQKAVDGFMRGRYIFWLWADFADEREHTVNLAFNNAVTVGHVFVDWALEHLIVLYCIVFRPSWPGKCVATQVLRLRTLTVNKQNKQQTRTIKVFEMTKSLRRHCKSRSHGKDCLKRWLFKHVVRTIYVQFIGCCVALAAVYALCRLGSTERQMTERPHPSHGVLESQQ